MLIEESPKALASEFIANRIKMQRDYCSQIERDFAGSVRAAIPLFDDEIRGVESLRRMSAALFA
jgi:anion-transporting  ArsA/GET3 family ATPase